MKTASNKFGTWVYKYQYIDNEQDARQHDAKHCALEMDIDTDIHIMYQY